jgi:hypothetical protein
MLSQACALLAELLELILILIDGQSWLIFVTFVL